MLAAPTAATAGDPTRPIHAISVRLYAVWTSAVAIIGRASPVRDVKIWPCSKSIFLLIYTSNEMIYHQEGLPCWQPLCILL